MILGYEVEPIVIVVLGILNGLLLVLTMLVGLRFIKFKGRRHTKVHRRLAWSVLAVAAIHALFALTYIYAWNILS